MKRVLPVALMVLLAFPVNAAAETLTMERALARVYTENPSILAARYNLRATQELYPQAIAGWRPRIAAEAGMTSTHIEAGEFNRGDGATTKSATVSVEQPLFRGFRTLAETGAAKQRIEADAQALRQTEQELFVRTAEVYMDVIRNRLLLLLQHQNRDLLARERESVLARFGAGDITQTDVRQTEARYASAIASDAAAESRLRQSEAAFEQVTGLPPDAVLAMPSPSFSFPESVDDMVADAALYNPRLSGLRHRQDAAEEDIRVARSDFYPQVSAFANHTKEYDPQPGLIDESEASAIGVRATMSLYEGGATASRVRQARARASQRFVEIQSAETSVRADILSQRQRLRALEAEIAAREIEVSAARYSAEGVREEARIGDRTVLDTLEADQAVLEAESALVDARTGHIVTAYRLAATLGMLTPQAFGIGEADPAVDLYAYRDE